MKSLLLFFVIYLPGTWLFAQAKNNDTIITQPGAGIHTYAVVVGISTYESSGMPQLAYAHKDALFFADYLKSKSGGEVPDDNIRLLINENATYAAIYEALDWLLTTCKKDDLVYFYFSGHGDMETNTIYKLGFLLSYNTPRTNYINNAVRIEDLNNIANTLSIKVNAKVVLITDACHSGKLAGSDYRGMYLVGDQLRIVQNKEIRITSCAPDQLSAEDEGWGGGRGVFSYYLVNGLEGMADANQDKIVSVNEIKTYLDTALTADALLVQKAMKQNPVIKGNSVFKLAAVDDSSLTALKKKSDPLVLGQGMEPMVGGSLTPLPVQPQTWFFNLLLQQAPEELIDFKALNKAAKENIAFTALQMLADSARKRFLLGNTDSTQMARELQRISQLEQTLRQNKDALNRFNNKLAVVLSDRGQEIINRFLEGDAAELERRRYYNSRSNGYDVYPPMFAVALRLTSPDNYLYQLLQIKLHYFTGVAARLKIPTVDNPAALIDTALAEQTKAFQLEENAAYIHNELGTLALLKNQPAAAEKSFIRATQIAPQWVVPWTNLAGLYTLKTKTYPQSAQAVQTAISLQPEFQGAYINKAVLKEKQGALLSAEELFRKSIELNSRHYLPFERLGFVYMHSTQYALADSFFYEADKRKKGFHVPDKIPLALNIVASPEFETIWACNWDSADIDKNDVMGQFVLGMAAFKAGNDLAAEQKFKQVIGLDKSNPLAFHYLGILLYRQKRWQEADIIFKLAISYFLDTTALNAYVHDRSLKMKNTNSRDCIGQEFRHNAYPGIEDHYFAGTLYQQWNHYAEAEQQYRQIISADPGALGGYYLLWAMLEAMGRYKDAEEAVRSYGSVNKQAGINELNSFYKRMTTRFPDSGDWFYKAGLFLYGIAAANPDAFPYDVKIVEPDTHAEQFINNTAYVNHVMLFIKLPGIRNEILPAKDIFQPFTNGIENFKKADSLLQDEEAIADINYKTGDLYVWQGLAAKAAPFYKKSIDFKPDNANTRLKLVDIYDLSFQFSNAMDQLDSLYRRHEINFDKQLLMAKYYIHESRFTEALVLLKDAKQVHPYTIPAIADLNGRLLLLSGQPKQALGFYKNFLLANPGDAGTMYSIAGIYAKTGNTAEAWRWLEMAMAKGFNYGWVLQFDKTWDKYRKQAKWIALQKRFPPRQYVNTDA
ncbi:MAG: caspase family protein [Chitinophagaceae bacterium]